MSRIIIYRSLGNIRTSAGTIELDVMADNAVDTAFMKKELKDDITDMKCSLNRGMTKSGNEKLKY
jgi:hypothetical protein